MSDETMAEAVPAPETPDSSAHQDAPRTEAPNPTSTPSSRPGKAPAGESAPVGGAGDDDGADATGDPTRAPALGPDGLPRKRRRRGSRGGRNRRPSAGGTTAGTSSGASALDEDAGDAARGGDDGSGEESSERRGHDRNAAADRGLTTDDLAETAMEDAGLKTPRVGDTRPVPKVAPARPRIGDSRPAAPSTSGGGGTTAASDDAASGEARTGAPKKRRRRGGKGRSRTGGGGGARPASSGGRSSEVVTSAVSADDGLDLEDLDDETLARRRGRTRKGRPTGRYQMVVHVDGQGVIQMAVLEGRVLAEHYVSRSQDDDTSIDGNIYLGKVQNVLPGMEAAFVDLGTPKNGVLYRGDVSFDESEVEEAQPKIERLLKNGQPVLVQVTKNPIGAKGARLTQEVSLAGRFVVMVPGQPTTYGISKRLPDDERRRLRKVLEGMRPENAGLIVRTAAEGATPEELERDLARLQDQWKQISSLVERGKPAKLLYKEPALVVRVIREEFTKEYRSIVIDDRALYEDVKSYVEAIAPELAERVELYDDPDLPIFERFHVHEQLHKALDRKVWLPSGGSLIIERTEALTVIDVNTGKNVGKSNLEETVFVNNLEAADEIARQLRLRDIGGIIVIDFIDMEIRKNRDEVIKAFRDALARDKTRTQVFDISELGLVEMTRKRISEGLVEAFSETCTICGGRGFLVDESML
ncbi:MAG: Rne/Rng family ribonuclease [Acidimicrobiia bacterium]